MTYHFVLAMFPMLLFLLTLLPFFNIKQSQITNMLSNAPAETSTLIKSVIGDIIQNSSGGLLYLSVLIFQQFGRFKWNDCNYEFFQCCFTM